MDGIDLIAIVAVILIVAMLARLVQGDIRRARAINSEVLRDVRIKARAEALREGDCEADSYHDRIAQDAIRSAVWAIQQRERAMSAAGSVMQPVEGQS